MDRNGRLNATRDGKLLHNEAGEPLDVDDVANVAIDLHSCFYRINAATKPEFNSPPVQRDKLGYIIPKSAITVSATAATVAKPEIPTED